MDWSAFIPSMLGASVPVVAFAFWLGGLDQNVKQLKEALKSAVETIKQRCDQRSTDHCHHYEQINKHSVEIGNINTRVTSLEQWRQRTER